MAGTGLLRQLAEMLAKRTAEEAPDLSRRNMFTLPPAPASVPSKVPQVYTPTAPTPTILDKPMTRRQVLEGAGKSALANALDVSPVGALARLATSPAAKTIEAAKVVSEPAAKFVPSNADRALSSSSWRWMPESDEDWPETMFAGWPALRTALKDYITPQEMKSLNSKVSRAKRKYNDEGKDAAWFLHETLADHIADLPPEVVMKATGYTDDKGNLLGEYGNIKDKRQAWKQFFADGLDVFPENLEPEALKNDDYTRYHAEGLDETIDRLLKQQSE